MYILKYKIKNRVWWENLELGGRFKIFNTGGYIMRTACRKLGCIAELSVESSFLQAGGINEPPVETLDFHRHPAQAVLQSACEKRLGTVCIVVLCTSAIHTCFWVRPH